MLCIVSPPVRHNHVSYLPAAFCVGGRGRDVMDSCCFSCQSLGAPSQFMVDLHSLVGRAERHQAGDGWGGLKGEEGLQKLTGELRDELLSGLQEITWGGGGRSELLGLTQTLDPSFLWLFPHLQTPEPGFFPDAPQTPIRNHFLSPCVLSAFRVFSGKLLHCPKELPVPWDILRADRNVSCSLVRR